MTMKSKNSAFLAIAVGLATFGASQAQTTVYQVGAAGNTFYANSLEFGDQITLGGTDRVLSSIQFSYFANYAQTGGLTFRLYANDGTAGAPGTVLYTSSPLDILNGGGDVTIPFLSSSDPLPNSLTYTVSFAGSGTAGLYVPNAAPSVGSSFNDFWVNNGGTWQLNTLTSGDLANFQITVTAVPEPSTVALAALGAAAFLGFAARRRSAK